MTTNTDTRAGFSLLELLVAMAIFTLAAVSLTKAINLISLSVVESQETSFLRERMRAVMLTESRVSNPRTGSRETEKEVDGSFLRVEVEQFNAENREGISLDNFFEVTVIAMREDQILGAVEIDRISTLVYPGLFQTR